MDGCINNFRSKQIVFGNKARDQQIRTLYTHSWLVSIAELNDEIQEILSLSDIKPKHFQYDIIGPRINKAYEKLRSEKLSTDCYLLSLMGYVSLLFQDFESHSIIFVGLDGKKIQLSLKQ